MTTAEEIKSRLDIVDVIREYVPLKAAGANWKGRCPFHEEKTPSFMVSKPKQMWHCFGCGEGGDLLAFVMKQEGLDFPDALRLLAARAGVAMRDEVPRQRTEREHIGRVLAAAVTFWEETLWKAPEARAAREYLQNERRILPATIREWHLGYAPDSWEALAHHLSALGFTDTDLVQAGVAARKMALKGRTIYDRFRNRIMFPLTNVHGQVVGATGRILPGGANTEAKYVNTPETSLYRKSAVLYGLDRAKQAIRQQNLAVAVEGNVDVITSHQAGLANVVAASGTAFTSEQARLIKRFTDRIAFAFDADTAGESATLRGLFTALQEGLDVLLITLPAGPDGQRYKDPDECIRENPERWREAIVAGEPLLESLFRRAVITHDAQTVVGKRAIVQHIVPVLGRLVDTVTVAHYLQKLSSMINVPESDLRTLLAKEREAAGRAESDQPVKQPVPEKVEHDPLEPVSSRFVAGLLAAPADAGTMIEVVTPAMLGERWQGLYTAMIVFYTGEQHTEPRSWLDGRFADYLTTTSAPADLKQLLDVASLFAENEFADLAPADIRRDLIETAKRLRQQFLKRSLERLTTTIREAEAAIPRDEARLETLLTELKNLGAELTHLETT